jgi:hypothetical protein
MGKDKRFIKQVRAVMKHRRETGLMPNGDWPSCVLCGYIFQPGEDVNFDLFFPFNQKRVGAPPNKVRSFVCALCDSCFHLPDRQQRVEDKILAEGQVE